MIFDVFKHKPTLVEVKAKFAEEHYPKLSPAGRKSYDMSFKYCSEFYHKPFKSIKYAEWQSVIDELHAKGLHYGSQKKLKNLVGQLCKYAIKNEISKVNYAPMLELDKNIPVYQKEPFSEEEVEILWKNIDMPHVDIILMLIYTGVRISELLRVNPKTDLFINDNYFIVRKSKTISGRNRPVPINDKIKDFFIDRMKNDVLIVDDKKRPVTYSRFRTWFNIVMRDLHMDHKIHECRHTLATMMDNAGANDVATKKILGHACNGVTKQVYTHKKIKDLCQAINLI